MFLELENKPWINWVIAIVAVLILFNQIQITQLLSATSPAQSPIKGLFTTSNSTLQEVINTLIPRGIPELYGGELKITFDDPVAGMNILNQYDDLDGGSRGTKKIALSAELQKRYISIGSRIACEFCCGAQTMVFADGKPACGCAHSGAMRGLAKYLLQNHAEHYTDEQILQELIKWKTLFFPKQMIQKYLQSQGQIDTSALSQIPSQIGGC